MTNGMAPPGTPAAQSCCLRSSGMWWSFLSGVVDQIFAMVAWRLSYASVSRMLSGEMLESEWWAEPPERTPSVVSMVSTPYCMACCMAPREFSWWVEWMCRVRGTSLLLEVSFSSNAGIRVETRSAVSWPDMSFMAIAV